MDGDQQNKQNEQTQYFVDEVNPTPAQTQTPIPTPAPQKKKKSSTTENVVIAAAVVGLLCFSGLGGASGGSGAIGSGSGGGGGSTTTSYEQSYTESAEDDLTTTKDWEMSIYNDYGVAAYPLDDAGKYYCSSDNKRIFVNGVEDTEITLTDKTLSQIKAFLDNRNKSFDGSEVSKKVIKFFIKHGDLDEEDTTSNEDL